MRFKFKERLINWLVLALLLACAKSLLEWGFTYWQAYFLDGLTARDQGRFWLAMAWLPAVLIAEAILSSGTTLASARAVLQSRERAASAHGALFIPGALLVGREPPDLVQTVVEAIRRAEDLLKAFGLQRLGPDAIEIELHGLRVEPAMTEVVGRPAEGVGTAASAA